MRILLTNDDGLNSNGMLHLEAELANLGEVWAVAPDRQRSATSMALSIHDTLRVMREDEKRWKVSGFPADCVNVALFAEPFPKFDLVVSGINHGVNMGDDVHYSGTVGAARHGALHGLPAVAVSSPEIRHDGDFHRAARWTRLWLAENLNELKVGIVYNINYPHEENPASDAELPSARLTNQGRRVYHDAYEELEKGEDYFIIRLRDTQMGHEDEARDTDFEAVEQGFVSITPLGLDQTEQQEKPAWARKKTQEKK